MQGRLADAEKLSRDAVVISRTVDDAVRHYLSETGSGADLRTPVVRAANRATRLRVAADVIADITTLRPPSSHPRARALLEVHAEAVSERLAGESDKTWRPISDEFVRALRAEGTQDDAAISAVLPLVAILAPPAPPAPPAVGADGVPTSVAEPANTRDAITRFALFHNLPPAPNRPPLPSTTA